MTYQNFGRIVKKTAMASLYMFAAIGRGVEGVRLYEALQRLGDQDLKALGITRDGIARYVAEHMDPRTHRRAEKTIDVQPFSAVPANQTGEQRRAA